MADPRTLNDLFLLAVERFAAKPAALRYKHGGRWHSLSHAELRDRVLTLRRKLSL